MPVTAGSISIARRINTGDYSHKEAKVELHYTAEGGEKIGYLGDTARVEALTQLSMILATVVKVEHTPTIVIDEEIAKKIEPKPKDAVDVVVEAGKRHRRAKAETGAGMQVISETLGEPKVESFLPDPVGDVKAAAPLLIDVEITDKELNNLCNETMLRIKNKVSIQAVIGEYTQGAVSTIPQSARAAFMQKLQALQP